MIADSYLFSSIGGREVNQDALGERKNAAGGLFVVADGLGGHQNGRQAADCVVDTLLQNWDAAADMDPECLKARIGEANQAVLNLQQEKNSNMKSTVVVLALQGGSAVWANTGDSRLYCLHEDRIAAVTADHSVAYTKYLGGEISRDQIATDEDQSRLLRSLGSPDRWEPNTAGRSGLCPGDAFFLCSDGMWEYLRDEEILFDRLKAASAQEWGELLLLRVMARLQPGNDNLSFITLILEPDNEGA